MFKFLTCIAFFVIALVSAANGAETLAAGSFPIQFLMDGKTHCPMTEALKEQIHFAFEKTRHIFDEGTYLPSLFVSVGCGAAWVKNDILILGQPLQGPPVQASTVVHEIAHAVLGRKLGPEVAQINADYMRAYKRCSPCGIDSADMREYKKFENQNRYLLGLHEYFADVIAVLVLEQATIGDHADSRRDFSAPFLWSTKRNWHADQEKKLEDTHYYLQPIWPLTYQLATKTFGNVEAKRAFALTLMQVISEDVERHLVDYETKRLDLKELNERIRSALIAKMR